MSTPGEDHLEKGGLFFFVPVIFISVSALSCRCAACRSPSHNFRHHAPSLFSALGTDHFPGLCVDNQGTVIRLVLQPAIGIKRSRTFRLKSFLLIFALYNPCRHQSLFLAVFRIELHIAEAYAEYITYISRVNQFLHLIFESVKGQERNIPV